jgi:hypothetical protein
VLASAAEELDLWIDVADVAGEGPSSILVACNEPGDAERLAQHCGIDYRYSVSDQLSAMLPPLAAYVSLWRPGSLPQGFPVERFSESFLGWEEIAEEEATQPGLYRCRTYREHVHVLVPPAGPPLRVPREHAVYEVLRWDEDYVLEYDEERHELWVPVEARLPLLHERAAVLCSGQLGRFKRVEDEPGRLYVNVQPEVAARIAASLSQQLLLRD